TKVRNSSVMGRFRLSACFCSSLMHPSSHHAGSARLPWVVPVGGPLRRHASERRGKESAVDDQARAERARRDQAATEEHDQRVAAGEELILARANDGRLISYRPEEYGFDKAARGRPQVTTVWGDGGGHRVPRRVRY